MGERDQWPPGQYDPPGCAFIATLALLVLFGGPCLLGFVLDRWM